jgi:hypothetical protein
MNPSESSPLSDAARSWDMLHSRTESLSVTPKGKDGGELGGLFLQSLALAADVKPAPEPQVVVVDDVKVSVVLMRTAAGIDVCGGRIGTDNTKFCAVECGQYMTSCGRFAAHDKKADLESPCYYIETSKSGVAFLQPRLQVPVGGFPEVIIDSLSGVRSSQEWVEVFSGLRNIESYYGSDQRDIVARVNRRINLGPTPMLIRKRNASIDLEEAMMESMVPANVWEPSGDDLETVVLMEDGLDSDAAIVHMQTNWNHVVRATQRQRLSATDMDSAIRGLLEEVDDKVVKVAAVLGDFPSNAPAVTVWASVGAHTDTLSNCIVSLKSTKKDLELRWSGVQAEVAAINQIISNRILPVVQHLTTKVEVMTPPSDIGDLVALQAEYQMMGRRFHMLSDEMASIKDAHRVAGDPQVVSGLVGDVKVLEGQYHELKRLVSSLGRSADSSMRGDYSAEIQELRELVGCLHDELRAVQVENVKIRAELNSEGITICGHYFQAPASYKKFIVEHLPSGYYGFCYDFISLLECYGDEDRTSNEGLDNFYKVVRTGYEDTQQARIDTSFSTVVPAVFGPKQEVANPAKKLALLTSLEVWDHPSTASGLQVTITDFIYAYQSSVESQIESLLGASSVASLFFLGLLQQTITFWETYRAWITQFERALSHQAGGEDPTVHKKSVWSLVCWMTHAMFVEMKSRRSPGRGYSKVTTGGDPQVKCSKILQGTLAGHKFMAELIAAKFVRHPIFSATMDEYLLKTKASHETMVIVQAKLKKLEEGFKGVQASADKALQAVKKPPVK